MTGVEPTLSRVGIQVEGRLQRGQGAVGVSHQAAQAGVEVKGLRIAGMRGAEQGNQGLCFFTEAHLDFGELYVRPSDVGFFSQGHFFRAEGLAHVVPGGFGVTAAG